jgi:hypothetical protein
MSIEFFAVFLFFSLFPPCKFLFPFSFSSTLLAFLHLVLPALLFLPEFLALYLTVLLQSILSLSMPSASGVLRMERMKMDTRTWFYLWSVKEKHHKIRCNDNIQMNLNKHGVMIWTEFMELKPTGLDDKNWIQRTRDRIQLQTLMKTKMNFRIP